MLDIPPNDFEPSSRHYWYRERRNISPKDRMIDELWKAGAFQKKFDVDQAAMVLRAVARGRLISGAQIDAGPFFRDLSPTAMHITDPEEKAVVDMLIVCPCLRFSFLFGIEIDLRDKFREGNDYSSPETSLTTPFPALNKQR